MSCFTSLLFRCCCNKDNNIEEYQPIFDEDNTFKSKKKVTFYHHQTVNAKFLSFSQNGSILVELLPDRYQNVYLFDTNLTLIDQNVLKKIEIEIKRCTIEMIYMDIIDYPKLCKIILHHPRKGKIDLSMFIVENNK